MFVSNEYSSTTLVYSRNMVIWNTLR